MNDNVVRKNYKPCTQYSVICKDGTEANVGDVVQVIGNARTLFGLRKISVQGPIEKIDWYENYSNFGFIVKGIRFLIVDAPEIIFVKRA